MVRTSGHTRRACESSACLVYLSALFMTTTWYTDGMNDHHRDLGDSGIVSSVSRGHEISQLPVPCGIATLRGLPWCHVLLLLLLLLSIDLWIAIGQEKSR